MKTQKGFTLIEILAAMVIISIGLISLLALFPPGIALNERSAGQTKGSLLCQSMIQDIRKAASSTTSAGSDPVYIEDLQDDGDEWYNFGKYRDPAENEAREVFPDDTSYEVSVSLDDAYAPYRQGDGMMAVVVTAYWPKAGNDPQLKDKQDSISVVSFVKYQTRGEAPPEP